MHFVSRESEAGLVAVVLRSAFGQLRQHIDARLDAFVRNSGRPNQRAAATSLDLSDDQELCDLLGALSSLVASSSRRADNAIDMLVKALLDWRGEQIRRRSLQVGPIQDGVEVVSN